MVAMKPLMTLEASFRQRGSLAVLPLRSIFVSEYVSVVLWVSDELGEFFVPRERSLTFDESTTVPPSPLRDMVSVTVPSLRMSRARLCERKFPLSLMDTDMLDVHVSSSSPSVSLDFGWSAASLSSP